MILTLINRRIRNKGFTTSELAITCLLVVSAFTAIKIFTERTLKEKVENAARWSAANDGLGQAYDEHGYNEQYASQDMNNTENSSEALNIATDSMTQTQGGGTDATGTKTTEGVSN